MQFPRSDVPFSKRTFRDSGRFVHGHELSLLKAESSAPLHRRPGSRDLRSVHSPLSGDSNASLHPASPSKGSSAQSAVAISVPSPPAVHRGFETMKKMSGRQYSKKSQVRPKSHHPHFVRRATEKECFQIPLTARRKTMPRRLRNPLIMFLLTDVILVAYDLAESTRLLLT